MNQKDSNVKAVKELMESLDVELKDLADDLDLFEIFRKNAKELVYSPKYVITNTYISIHRVVAPNVPFDGKKNIKRFLTDDGVSLAVYNNELLGAVVNARDGSEFVISSFSLGNCIVNDARILVAALDAVDNHYWQLPTMAHIGALAYADSDESISKTLQKYGGELIRDYSFCALDDAESQFISKPLRPILPL